MFVQEFCWILFKLLYFSFGNAYPTHIHSLVVAQKKCVRIIAIEPPYAHSDPIFNTFKLLKFADMYKYNLGIYMYKNIDNLSSNLFQCPYSTRSGTYYVQSRRTLTSNQSINVEALCNWNITPETLKNSPSVIPFKKTIRVFIMDASRFCKDCRPVWTWLTNIFAFMITLLCYDHSAECERTNLQFVCMLLNFKVLPMVFESITNTKFPV